MYFFQIDYQMAFCTSLALDLNYFMYSSPDTFTRQNHYDDIIENYYLALKETLEKFDFDSKRIPTLKEVIEEVNQFKFYGLLFHYK